MLPTPPVARRFLTAAALSIPALGVSVRASSAQSAHVTQAGAPIGKPVPGKPGVRLGAPPDGYVAERAKNADIEGKRAVTQEVDGKKIRFTPARVTDNLDDAAQGFVLGILETEAEGSETGLPPGRYTVFAKNVGGEWEAYAEQDGAVVQQALTVTATDARASSDGETPKPKFALSEGVWCWATGPYPAPTAWRRYDSHGYWHYYPAEWGRYQTLTVCW